MCKLCERGSGTNELIMTKQNI